MPYADANYWIALFCDREENHARAVELSHTLSTQRMYVSEHALGEVFTVIAMRYGAHAAYGPCAALLHDPLITVVQASELDWKPALNLALKHEVSFTDALTIMLMRHDGEQRILSFDAEFDGFPGVKRIR